MTRISKEDQRFIELVAGGLTYYEAWIQAFDKKESTKKTAMEMGSKKAKRYASEIDIERKKVGEIIEDVKRDALITIAVNSFMSKSERMALLTRIAKGEEVVENKVMVGGEWRPMKAPANLGDRIKAVAELNKMDGSYAPIEVEQSGVMEIRRTIITRQVGEPRPSA